MHKDDMWISKHNSLRNFSDVRKTISWKDVSTTASHGTKSQLESEVLVDKNKTAHSHCAQGFILYGKSKDFLLSVCRRFIDSCDL